MEKVRITKTWGGMTLLFPLFKDGVWERNGEKWKKGIYSVSNELMQECITSGSAESISD